MGIWKKAHSLVDGLFKSNDNIKIIFGETISGKRATNICHLILRFWETPLELEEYVKQVQNKCNHLDSGVNVTLDRAKFASNGSQTLSDRMLSACKNTPLHFQNESTELTEEYMEILVALLCSNQNKFNELILRSSESKMVQELSKIVFDYFSEPEKYHRREKPIKSTAKITTTSKKTPNISIDIAEVASQLKQSEGRYWPVPEGFFIGSMIINTKTGMVAFITNVLDANIKGHKYNIKTGEKKMGDYIIPRAMIKGGKPTLNQFENWRLVTADEYVRYSSKITS